MNCIYMKSISYLHMTQTILTIKILVVVLSYVQLFVNPWTIQSMEFSRPEYWSGLPFPSPGDLPKPGIKPRSSTLQVDSLPADQGIR